ncbi:cytochrome P450 2U1-like isoform X2 [Branchiostoma floridae]|uniref:Cytochrome P450 2U1-like isoform X1 n=1 Tax=Branchiostoma floridae TaxID=7739 RepID=A0A9J7NAL0_BRAFL|nr:cytochrome P450 2U1-like isoform X1 [Branchiostoma floridae]XP_035695870.1 cytochrome P450 2U1-like isoform X2 [Branchiostoma floridae]
MVGVGLFSFVTMDLQTLLFLLLLVMVIVLVVRQRRRRLNLPPGPRGFPIVGNLFSMRPSKLLANMAAWRQQYGDVYSLRLLNRIVVVLYGHKPIHDALVKQADIFSDRPPIRILRRDPGLVMARYGEHWAERRRFALSALRQFGMGRRSAEGRIREEAAALCTAIRSLDGAQRDISHLLGNAVSNIICSMSFGNRFEYDDAEFKRLSHAFAYLVGSNNRSILALVRQFIMPYLRKLPMMGNWRSYGIKQNDYVIDFIMKSAKEHKETFDKSDIRDIIDVFLSEGDGSEKGNGVNEEALGTIIRDLFIAGSETTATTLRWGLLYTALNPDVQTKVQEEIDREFASHAPPWSERGRLPYTEATIMEIQRIRPIVPLNIFHGNTSATTLYGYDIPAGTYIIPSLWSAMMDPKVTPEPEEFRPERFLDDEGKVVKPEWFLPFSAGRRRCLGEQLAKMELFLFYTSLLQHFTFKLPDGAPAPPMDGSLGFVLSPPAYDICAVPRHSS